MAIILESDPLEPFLPSAPVVLSTLLHVIEFRHKLVTLTEMKTKKPEDSDPIAFVPKTPSSQWDYVYEVVGFRRQTTETMAWQAPIMSLTAQAFLMMIALGPEYSDWARGFAATLSLFTNIVSWQTMAKHRMFEIEDAKWLAAYEKMLKDSVTLPGESSDGPDERPLPHDRPSIARKRAGFFTKRKSFQWWTFITVIFAVLSIFVLMSAIFQWHCVWASPVTRPS